jgi:hypothetical protein
VLFGALNWYTPVPAVYVPGVTSSSVEEVSHATSIEAIATVDNATFHKFLSLIIFCLLKKMFLFFDKTGFPVLNYLLIVFISA